MVPCSSGLFKSSNELPHFCDSVNGGEQHFFRILCYKIALLSGFNYFGGAIVFEGGSVLEFYDTRLHEVSNFTVKQHFYRQNEFLGSLSFFGRLSWHQFTN